MESINLQVSVIITSGISLIMGFYMLVLQSSVPKIKGPAYWATGNLVIGSGFLFKFIPPADGFLALGATQLFVTTGLCLYLAGIWRFKEKNIIKWIVIGIPAADLIQSFIFLQLFPSNRISGILHSVFLMVYCLIAIYEMLTLTPDQKYLKTIFRMNAFSFLIFLGVLIFSIVAISYKPDYNPLQLKVPGAVVFIIASLLITALTFGFISAVNIRLNKELENQLSSKNRFFAIIAHDLRGPVGNIMSVLNFINSEPDLKETQKKQFLKEIESLCQSTFHLLQNLLDWASTTNNLAQFQSKVIDLNQLVSTNITFLDNLTKLKSINLEYTKGQETYIQGNAHMLNTVIRNLVTNAIKFTPSGGKITITLQSVSNTARLIVADTGCGIQPEKLNDLFIFERNELSAATNREPGSGLGLILCKDFINKNNGILQVKSQLNLGTEVMVEFPLAN